MKMTRNVQGLAVVGVIALVAACLLPAFQPARWVADGHLRLPVRVIVFDAVQESPIEGATVALFHAAPGEEGAEVPEALSQEELERLSKNGLLTGRDGTVVIEYELSTSASDRSPEMKAHLRWKWVLVSAEGYGTVVVPIRYESQRVELLKEQGELPVVIGLVEQSP